jgi:hypothetical protein
MGRKWPAQVFRLSASSDHLCRSVHPCVPSRQHWSQCACLRSQVSPLVVQCARSIGLICWWFASHVGNDSYPVPVDEVTGPVDVLRYAGPRCWLQLRRQKGSQVGGRKERKTDENEEERADRAIQCPSPPPEPGASHEMWYAAHLSSQGGERGREMRKRQEDRG